MAGNGLLPGDVFRFAPCNRQAGFFGDALAGRPAELRPVSGEKPDAAKAKQRERTKTADQAARHIASLADNGIRYFRSIGLKHAPWASWQRRELPTGRRFPTEPASTRAVCRRPMPSRSEDAVRDRRASQGHSATRAWSGSRDSFVVSEKEMPADDVKRMHYDPASPWGRLLTRTVGDLNGRSVARRPIAGRRVAVAPALPCRLAAIP